MSTMRDVLDTKGYFIHTTTTGTTIDDAVIEMSRAKVGALLVLDEGHQVGIVSERDILLRVLLAHKDPSSTTVGEIMTRDVVHVELGTTLHGAMSVMTRRRCRHLPVEREGRTVGLVSIGDLVRTTCQEQEREIRSLYDFVEGRYPG
jgi:CBS domain-containing protein